MNDRFTAQIVENSKGYNWIGTGNGLNRFNPRTDQTKLYREPDGLADNIVDRSAPTIAEDAFGPL